MAEAVFQKMVDEAGLGEVIEADSAGTGSWHVGEPAYAGTRRVLADNGIAYTGYARVVRQEEVRDADTYVVAMDGDNIRELRRRFGHHAHHYLLLDFARRTDERFVPDPYYEGNFEYVYELVVDGCEGLLAAIVEENKLNAE